MNEPEQSETLTWFNIEASNDTTVQVFKVKAVSPDQAVGYVLRTTHWATDAKHIDIPAAN